MDGSRRALRWVAAVVAVATVAVVATPAASWAQDEPPDVRGLPVTEATARLAEWNRSVFFIYEPPPDIGLDMDPVDVVVSRMELATAPAASSANRPVVRLITGRLIPDLSGLTREQALTAIARRELVLATSPTQAPATWVVNSQRPAPGTILEFTERDVTVVLADPGTPPDPDGGWLGLSRPTLVALGGSSVAVLAILALLGTLALRRARRRRGPPGGTVSVRLVPRYDPGTLTLHQDGRR
jgi:hypothetical protein